jgi:hypothetical protein
VACGPEISLQNLDSLFDGLKKGSAFLFYFFFPVFLSFLFSGIGILGFFVNLFWAELPLSYCFVQEL